jgi:hypothetical protein
LDPGDTGVEQWEFDTQIVEVIAAIFVICVLTCKVEHMNGSHCNLTDFTMCESRRRGEGAPFRPLSQGRHHAGTSGAARYFSMTCHAACTHCAVHASRAYGIAYASKLSCRS